MTVTQAIQAKHSGLSGKLAKTHAKIDYHSRALRAAQQEAAYLAGRISEASQLPLAKLVELAA